MRNTLLLLSLLLMLPAALQAQEVALADTANQAKKPLQGASRYYWFGFSANKYKGDLNDGLMHFKPGVHLGMKLNSTKRLNASFALGLGQLSGQDPDFKPLVEPPVIPNNYFETTFFTLDLSLQYHLIKKPRYQLYLSQGIGLVRYNPFDEEDQELLNKNTSRLAGEAYSNISLQLPTAVGATYFLPNQWGIGLQAAYLNPLTDYLDNIGKLGSNKGNDNALQFRLMILLPVK